MCHPCFHEQYCGCQMLCCYKTLTKCTDLNNETSCCVLNSSLSRTFVIHSKCRHQLAGLCTPIVYSRVRVTSRTQCQKKCKRCCCVSRPEKCMQPNDALLRTLKAQISQRTESSNLSMLTATNPKDQFDKQNTCQNCHDSTMYRESAHPYFCPKNSAA